MLHGLMDTIPRTKTKPLPLQKMRVYHSKNHVIPHPVIAAILNAILNIFTTLKNNNNMPEYSRKLSEIATNCEFDFRLNFALNGGHLGHHLHYFNLVNLTCEYFILIVCIIRPLNLDK